MKSNIATLSIIHFSLFICLLFCGCRREDIRACSIEFPGLTTENAIQMRNAANALKGCPGVDGKSYTWTMSKGGNLMLSLRYDSMQIAQTNLRMALKDRGMDVVFPPNNASGLAGYVDEKPSSVK